MFGDVGQPEPVRAIGGELMPDAPGLVHDRAKVVVDWRACLLAVPAALLSERAPPAVVAADPPRRPISHRLSGVASFIGQQPMPEFRVILVSIEQRVGAIRLHPISVRDRLLQPSVVGLAGELENPARHRHGYPVSGELCHERVEPFPGRWACPKYAAARRSTSTSCSSSRLR